MIEAAHEFGRMLTGQVTAAGQIPRHARMGWAARQGTADDATVSAGRLATARSDEAPVAIGWAVLIPLKPLHTAKSRLLLPVAVRKALVEAMALDVMEAVLGCPDVHEVVLVSRDPCWQALSDHPRISVLCDSPRDSMNDALRRGAAACRREWPGTGIAALTGDLPALSSGDLDAALGQASLFGSSFVPDAGGEGTTLLAAPCASRFHPLYGPGSRLRHWQAGAMELEVPPGSGLRQDVDTLDDLALAQAIGVRRHTSTVLSCALR